MRMLASSFLTAVAMAILGISSTEASTGMYASEISQRKDNLLEGKQVSIIQYQDF